MALSASKASSCPRDCFGISNSYAKSLQRSSFHCSNQGVELRQLNYGCLLTEKKSVYNDGSWHVFVKPVSFSVSQRSSDIHLSRGTHTTTEKEGFTTYNDCAEKTGSQIGGEDEHPVFPERTIHSSQGLTEACKFVFNDAKFVNERARNDIILLSRGILSLDARARQDVAILGSEFLKLDARAKEDSEIIDRKVKKKAERLHHIARILKDKAESRLKSVADKHWSDGALEADLRRADIHAKQRALQDALMALEFVKDIHDMMVNKMYNFSRQRTIGMQTDNEMLGHIMLEKNGKTLNFPPGQVSPDQITAIQEAYWSVASALSEADGFDYTNPEELELIIATLIDLDAMDGKSSVSLLAECSSSPDVNTRQALANALAAAPSMWTLGNAGMGALQRLAEDSNLAIASAATRAIYELKKQWEIEEGDNWRFTMNQYTMEEKGEDQEADDDLNSD